MHFVTSKADREAIADGLNPDSAPETPAWFRMASGRRGVMRIVGRDNGVGLSRDMQLIAEVLQARGGRVAQTGFGGGAFDRCREASLWLERCLRGRVDTQIFPERVYRRCLPLARRNLLVPNPEWFLPKWRRQLHRFDQILCKTHHAEAAFRTLGCATRYIGFSSQDRHDPAVPRRHAFFHLAGRSRRKGTEVLLDAWRRHPEWPLLTVVQHPRTASAAVRAHNIDYRIGYLDDVELRRLQNAHLFHICPSETEGFGHYLAEALSLGAVTLATDGEPMNELVTAECGIPIRPAGSMQEGLVRTWRVDVAGIEAAVGAALALDAAQRAQLRGAAREFFLRSDAEFRVRLAAAVLEDGYGAEPADGLVPAQSRIGPNEWLAATPAHCELKTKIADRNGGGLAWTND